MMTLNNFEVDYFLTNSWQQKPTLLRNALPNFQTPLSPNELAGLACEEAVESRLIIAKENNWQLIHGPLEDHHFEALPEKNWTLLVQAVDHWVPEVAELVEFFRFIPSWRIDDVMVSYACEGGSVGPHYDNYDVFLVQGLGQRLWKVGPKCDASTALFEHEDLNILENFESCDEWLLNPGDILYIPPGYSHWGIGQGEDCMTFSIGFRAPSHSEILSNFCDYQLELLNEQQRYKDPQLSPQTNPGEISNQAIEQIQASLRTLSHDKQAISQWFGQYMTEPKYSHLHQEEAGKLSADDLQLLLDREEVIYKNPASRFAFHTQLNQTMLFVDGNTFPSKTQSAAFSMYLCSAQSFATKELMAKLNTSDDKVLLLTLINQGCLFFDDSNND